MKKILFPILSLLIINLTFAQTNAEGEKHYYNQRYSSAENSFHRALSQQRSDVNAWWGLTRSYLQQDKIQKAKDSLQLAPVDIQNQPLYLVAKGSVLLASKDSTQAMTLFNQAIDMTRGKEPEVLMAIAAANIEAENGSIDLAFSALDKAEKKEKRNPAYYVLKGNGYRNLHNGTEAYKAYMKAIEEDANYAEAYYRLGKLFQSQNNKDLFLENFSKAVAADGAYAPAYYELYYYYMYTDPVKGMEYFTKYRPVAEQTGQLDYTYTDLLYLTKEYSKALNSANDLIRRDRESVPPRIYKLIAYSYKELGDTLSAINFMRNYFNNEVDSNYVVKDFETMAILHASQPAGKDSAMLYYAKAAEKTDDLDTRLQYYKLLASTAAEQKQYAEQAKWLGKFVNESTKVGNVDLFNWGIAEFRTQNFVQADSVFARYTREYPDQPHGFYWRARSNAAIDTAMVDTITLAMYQKVLDMTSTDTTNSSAIRQFKINAHSYLAAYAVNVKKDYDTAVMHFEGILELDPSNAQAKKYVEMFKKEDSEDKSADGNSGGSN